MATTTSSLLGSRLQLRTSQHTTEWLTVGIVEATRDAGRVLAVALRPTAATRLIEVIGHELPSKDGEPLLIATHLVELSPYLRLQEATSFCLDDPMGPSTGTQRPRPMRLADPGGTQ